jgi:hypothetical protein
MPRTRTGRRISHTHILIVSPLSYPSQLTRGAHQVQSAARGGTHSSRCEWGLPSIRSAHTRPMHICSPTSLAGAYTAIIWRHVEGTPVRPPMVRPPMVLSHHPSLPTPICCTGHSYNSLLAQPAVLEGVGQAVLQLRKVWSSVRFGVREGQCEGSVGVDSGSRWFPLPPAPPFRHPNHRTPRRKTRTLPVHPLPRTIISHWLSQVKPWFRRIYFEGMDVFAGAGYHAFPIGLTTQYMAGAGFDSYYQVASVAHPAKTHSADVICAYGAWSTDSNSTSATTRMRAVCASALPSITLAPSPPAQRSVVDPSLMLL